jgi:glycosyltransferase involved in cell wall biosynthesis
VSTGSKISIAMAVYNGERFIREQLESFVRQTRLPDELVVSDDASTDRSVEIVSEFVKRAPFPVRLLANERNVGCSKNFEHAIEACTGDLIFISDWDDVWHPEKLLSMERVFRASPTVGVAICDWQVVDENLRPVDGEARFLKTISRNPWCSATALANGSAFNHWLPPAGCCSAFRAKFKPLILPFPDGPEFRRGYYDYFLLWTIICSGSAGLALVPGKLVQYRRHGLAMNVASQAQAEKIRPSLRSDSRNLYLLRPVIDRIQSDVADSFCVSPALRARVLRHWSRRCSLPRRRFARVPAVLGELLSLRYHRFSSGFVTAAKDLLFVE